MRVPSIKYRGTALCQITQAVYKTTCWYWSKGTDTSVTITDEAPGQVLTIECTSSNTSLNINGYKRWVSCFSYNVNWKQQMCYLKFVQNRSRLHKSVTPPFFLQDKNGTQGHLFHFLFCVVADNVAVLIFVGLFIKTTSSSVALSGGRLEMSLLLWNGGYFFCVIGSIWTERSIFPSHFQVWTGSCQLLYSLQNVGHKKWERCYLSSSDWLY